MSNYSLEQLINIKRACKAMINSGDSIDNAAHIISIVDSILNMEGVD